MNRINKLLVVTALALMVQPLTSYSIQKPVNPTDQQIDDLKSTIDPAPAVNTMTPPVKIIAPVVPVNANIKPISPPIPGASPQLKNLANGAPPSGVPAVKPKVNTPPEFTRSLMFSQDDINKLRMVHKVYLDRIRNAHDPIKPNTPEDSKVEDILTKLGNVVAPQADLPLSPTSIYLNSILFRSIGNATVWLNGKKFEIDKVQDNIKLVSVSSTSAEVEWKMSAYKDTDINDWLAVFPQSTDKEASVKLPPSRHGIRVDANTKSIRFTLRPNQYLDIIGKSIREGKPKPVASTTAGILAPGALTGTTSADLGKMLTPDQLAIPEKIDPMSDHNQGLMPDPSSPAQAIGVTDGKKVTYKPGPDGHYDVTAKINGSNIVFRVDTGATYPVFSKEDAKRAGIDVDKLDYKYEARTASGATIKSARTEVTMEFEGVRFTDIMLMVADGSFPLPLLGQSFLNQYATIDHGTLTIMNLGAAAEAGEPVSPAPETPSTPPQTTKPDAPRLKVIPDIGK